ncbi:MAG: hypothetical protein WCJ46_06900 [bacterium]
MKQEKQWRWQKLDKIVAEIVDEKKVQMAPMRRCISVKRNKLGVLRKRVLN